MSISRNKALFTIATLLDAARYSQGERIGSTSASKLLEASPDLFVSLMANGFCNVQDDSLTLSAHGCGVLKERSVSLVSQLMDQWAEVHSDTLLDALLEIVDPEGGFVDFWERCMGRALRTLERSEHLTLCADSGVITRDW